MPSQIDASTVPRIAVPQIAVADLDVEQNLDTIVNRVTALDSGVDLAVFPEYALTGFVADQRSWDIALDRDGAELDRLAALAADADLALVAGFLERGGDSVESTGSLYNALAYVSPDGSRTIYRKRHLWGDEAAILARGKQLSTVETPLGTAGLATCYDLNFVGDSAEFTDREVDALLVAGAWPAAHSENWRLLLRARALDGVRWVVGACRTGRREVADAAPQPYAGRSAVVRPDGTVAAALDRGERDLLVDVDSAELSEHRDAIPIHEQREKLDSGRR